MWSGQMVPEPCFQLVPITEPVVRLLHSDSLISMIPVVRRGEFGVVYGHFWIHPKMTHLIGFESEKSRYSGRLFIVRNIVDYDYFFS